jgi:hypothetical protein
MGGYDRYKQQQSGGASCASEPKRGSAIDESVLLPGDEVSVELRMYSDDQECDTPRQSGIMLVWALLLVAFAVMAIGAAASLRTFD